MYIYTYIYMCVFDGETSTGLMSSMVSQGIGFWNFVYENDRGASRNCDSSG